jgi:hypothetical protein
MLLSCHDPSHDHCCVFEDAWSISLKRLLNDGAKRQRASAAIRAIEQGVA